MTATSTRPPRSRGTSGHTGTSLPLAPFVLPGRLLSPLGPRPKPLFVVNFPPLRPITRRRHPCRWVGHRRWAPLRRSPGVGCHRRSVTRTRRSSRTVDPQLSSESTGAFWSSLAAALLCCSEESRESPETFRSPSLRSPDISGADERPSHSPAIEPFCRPGQCSSSDLEARQSYEILRFRGPPMVRLLLPGLHNRGPIWRPRPISFPHPCMRQVDACSKPTFDRTLGSSRPQPLPGPSPRRLNVRPQPIV